MAWGWGVWTDQQVPPKSVGPCPVSRGLGIRRAVEFLRNRVQHGVMGRTWAPKSEKCEFETQLWLLLVGGSWTSLLTKLLPHLEIRVLLPGQPRGSDEGLHGDSGHFQQLTSGHRYDTTIVIVPELVFSRSS